MKITLPLEEDGFYLNCVQYFDRDAILITPKADAKWTKDNLIFRSILVDAKSLEVLSSGFPKFMNFGEKPECYPNPEEFIDWEVMEKVDGTLVIVDYYNGEINLRTRGTVSYKSQANALDFEQLLVQHQEVKTYIEKNKNLSLLFEIVTPNNVIVIRPEEIKFYFLGAVDKDSLTLKRVEGVFNHISPKRYVFDSLERLERIIKTWKGQEGVVLIYNKHQSRVKFKSEWYLWLHRVKSELSSENRLIELYIKLGMPSMEDFFKHIETEYDFEVASQLNKEITSLAIQGEEVKKIINQMSEFIKSIRNIESRKEQAAIIMNSYGPSNRTAMLFTLLDGKELNNQQLTKLISQQKEYDSTRTN